MHVSVESAVGMPPVEREGVDVEIRAECPEQGYRLVSGVTVLVVLDDVKVGFDQDFAADSLLFVFDELSVARCLGGQSVEGDAGEGVVW